MNISSMQVAGVYRDGIVFAWKHGWSWLLSMRGCFRTELWRHQRLGRAVITLAIVFFVCELEAQVNNGKGPRASRRPPHFLLQSGLTSTAGGQSSSRYYLSAEMLPGSVAGRWGLRGEWRADSRLSTESFRTGLVFEAGASRPYLVGKLLGEIGLTKDRNPILGAGTEWSFWLLPPIGASISGRIEVLVDGLRSWAGLTVTFGVHLGV